MTQRLGRLVRVCAVEPLEGYRVSIVFEDGVRREIDLEPYLHGPVFAALRGDPALFRAMKVLDGALAWDNGADIDPDVLYYGLKPAWMEEPEMLKRWL